MKLFQVIFDEDGERTVEPGKASTEVRRSQLYYAAETITEVWDATQFIREDGERNLISIYEAAPQITVLGGRA